MGALGSQVVDILVRSGFGLWSLVDADVLLPHNLARHALPSQFVGWAKAEAMGCHLASLLTDSCVERAIFADVLDPGPKVADLNSALETSDAILDLSASIAVERKLALDLPATARRISVFLNPTGSSSILLAEDDQRTTRLDCLEMQYYRAILSREELIGHLSPLDGPIRYARSCRDVSSTLPEQRVALHAALAAHAIKDALSCADSRIHLSVADDQDNVRSLTIPTAKVAEMELGAWKLVADSDFIAKLFRLRETDLPNETGGVLLGVWDLVHHIVYMVETIPAPPDSRKRTTSFIRGCEGLLDQVLQATEATGGMVQYVGEWHSHPIGFGTDPSGFDHKVFSWIGEMTKEKGYQPVMAIFGDHEHRWFVETMESHHASDRAVPVLVRTPPQATPSAQSTLLVGDARKG
jgi:integrative and conjugative element protein (TIGR02256 family)